MINRNEMMGLLLTVCPRVKPRWSAFLEDWRDDGVDPPRYSFFGDIARLVSSLYQEGCENELRDIFSVIERWCTEGDDYVREATRVGILEDLQNMNLMGLVPPKALIRFLGPQSSMDWHELEQFWGNVSEISP
ncbi:transposase [Aeromonas dhakensis]|uniref:DUF7674 family protein n=1 Tax=Aeromonas dhakensis TaxID=196024 RepID=UPI00244922BC|nr:transposase [Aeromonas dhakensis]MDH0176861.1 transposase [Aeromonas dhakensis]